MNNRSHQRDDQVAKCLPLPDVIGIGLISCHHLFGLRKDHWEGSTVIILSAMFNAKIQQKVVDTDHSPLGEGESSETPLLSWWMPSIRGMVTVLQSPEDPCPEIHIFSSRRQSLGMKAIYLQTVQSITLTLP
ncbi:hypothetical protein JTE90_025183 [Oedothorax gibbosus]|uniref:Uncharacterized protein n=1 Tax=Oedothorax gibbosus TaxID=931172 RepID=A0AAV6UB17_9ARAC|nr:hypothetical protein JTE90_025183 [Oedothorax gibbosus]